MRLATLAGYTLAFVADLMYGLPKEVNVAVYTLGDYKIEGQIPEGHRIFLGTGEEFNSWRHKFPEEFTEESIPVLVRIRKAGLRPFQSIGNLVLVEDEQHLILSDSWQLMRIDGIKQFQADVDRDIKAAKLRLDEKEA